MEKIREIIGMGMLVGKNHKYGVIDEEGNVLVPCEMDTILFHPDLDICIFEKDSLQGSYSLAAGYLPPLYENITIGDVPRSGWYQGKFGCFNEQLMFEEMTLENDDIERYKNRLTLKEEILREMNEMKDYLFKSPHVKDELYLDNYMDLTFYNKDGGYKLYFYGQHRHRDITRF